MKGLDSGTKSLEECFGLLQVSKKINGFKTTSLLLTPNGSRRTYFIIEIKSALAAWMISGLNNLSLGEKLRYSAKLGYVSKLNFW